MEKDSLIVPRQYGYIQLYAGATRGRMATNRADFKKIVIRPNEATSYHRHWIADSIFHVLIGDIDFYSGNPPRSVPMGPGVTVIVPAGEPHQLYNRGSRDAEILEIESPSHDSRDKILEDGEAPSTTSRRAFGTFWSRNPNARPPIKICGVSSIEGALSCIRAGVEAIGIHAIGAENEFARVLEWRQWLEVLPDVTSIFLLTAHFEEQDIHRLALTSGCDTVQVQGLVPPNKLCSLGKFLRPLGWKLVKSIGMDVFSEAAAREYCSRIENYVDAIVLDSHMRGGTGKTHNWAVARRLTEQIKVPIILAGGLNAANLREGLAEVQPWAVDIESGSEIQLLRQDGAGRVTAKSPEKLKEIVAVADNWWRERKRASPT